MKKFIVRNSRNGLESRMMGIEEVLEEFRGQAYKKMQEYKKGGIITEDDRQELDIVIFKAFQSYDEKHCFSTHLGWQLRSFLTEYRSYATCQKRNPQKYEFYSLDYTSSADDNKEVEMYGMLADDENVIEAKSIDKDLLRFIVSRLNPTERQLLAVSLGLKDLIEVAREAGTSKQNISNKNKRFKTKLLQLIQEYNA